MTYNTTSRFTDKQIMNLSNSPDNTDFIDFMSRQEPEKKDDVVQRFNFMPLRSALGSSSSTPAAARSLNFDYCDDDAPAWTFNSHTSTTDAFPNRNYNSVEAEPTKFHLGKNHKLANASLDMFFILEIDKTMKMYTDNLMHAIDSVSAQLSQLEARTCDLESSMGDLKLSLGNNHGSTDGRIRQLENILREVQTDVHVIRDKQEVIEAELHTANSRQDAKVEQKNESQNTPHIDSTQPVVSAHTQPSLSPHHDSQSQPQIQFHNRFPQNQVPSAPHQETYFPLPSQTPVYSKSPPPSQPQPSVPGFNLPPQPQYSQQPSFPGFSPQAQAPLTHPQEEVAYVLNQIYAPSTLPPSSVAPQQFYMPTPDAYGPPSNRPSSGYSSPSDPSLAHGEPYPYRSSMLHLCSDYPVNLQQLAAPMAQTGGSGYQNLPTAHVLPRTLPKASGTGGGSSNRVPVDDVIDRVTNMGFPRDQVRATVRKLTENGESVDLNVVLDKLMNDR